MASPEAHRQYLIMTRPQSCMSKQCETTLSSVSEAIVAAMQNGI